jgi:hypothetical protein
MGTVFDMAKVMADADAFAAQLHARDRQSEYLKQKQAMERAQFSDEVQGHRFDRFNKLYDSGVPAEQAGPITGYNAQGLTGPSPAFTRQGAKTEDTNALAIAKLLLEIGKNTPGTDVGKLQSNIENTLHLPPGQINAFSGPLVTPSTQNAQLRDAGQDRRAGATNDLRLQTGIMSGAGAAGEDVGTYAPRALDTFQRLGFNPGASYRPSGAPPAGPPVDYETEPAAGPDSAMPGQTRVTFSTPQPAPSLAAPKPNVKQQALMDKAVNDQVLKEKLALIRSKDFNVRTLAMKDIARDRNFTQMQIAKMLDEDRNLSRDQKERLFDEMMGYRRDALAQQDAHFNEGQDRQDARAAKSQEGQNYRAGLKGGDNRKERLSLVKDAIKNIDKEIEKYLDDPNLEEKMQGRIMVLNREKRRLQQRLINIPLEKPTTPPFSGSSGDPAVNVRANLDRSQGPGTFDKVDQIFRNAGVSTFAWTHNANRESGGNTNATGDGGTSFGLFQLHRGGLLGNLTPEQARDPLTAARVIAAEARRQGVHTIQDPKQQALAFTKKVERPAAYIQERVARELGGRSNKPSRRNRGPSDELMAQAFPKTSSTEAKNTSGLDLSKKRYGSKRR